MQTAYCSYISGDGLFFKRASLIAAHVAYTEGRYAWLLRETIRIHPKGITGMAYPLRIH